MRIPILLVFFLTSSSTAQTVVSVGGGINFRTGLLSLDDQSTNAQSWKAATSFTLALDHFVSHAIAISAGAEYDHYAFDSYHAYGAQIPEIWILSSSGDASQIARLCVDAKAFLSPEGPLSLYVTTGISYAIERIGSMHLTEEWLLSPLVTRVTVPGPSNYYWTHTLGVGVRYLPFERIGCDLKGQWFSNYSTRFYKSVTIGVFAVL